MRESDRPKNPNMKGRPHPPGAAWPAPGTKYALVLDAIRRVAGPGGLYDPAAVLAAMGVEDGGSARRILATLVCNLRDRLPGGFPYRTDPAAYLPRGSYRRREGDGDAPGDPGELARLAEIRAEKVAARPPSYKASKRYLRPPADPEAGSISRLRVAYRRALRGDPGALIREVYGRPAREW